MIKVDFYKFSKKDNSTKRPAIADRKVEYSSCLIKDGSGIVNPTLQIATKENVSEWNYCYIPEFNRYYFISEWTYDMGQWIASCRCDELATWKSQIGVSTQYIVRAASSTKWNGTLMDSYYPTTGSPVVQTVMGNVTELASSFSDAGYHYLVAIINNDVAQQVGCISYYAMTPENIAEMKQLLLTNNNWIGNVESGASSVEVSKSKVDINPFQYIVSCKWFPVVIPTGGNELTNIRTGWWASNLKGRHFYDKITWGKYFDMTLPKHPQAASRGVWLNNKTHTTYMLDYGGFHVDLDANMLVNATSIRCELEVDYIAGTGNLKVYGDEPNNHFLVAQVSQEFCVSLPLAQVNYSSEGLANFPIVGSVFKGITGAAQSIGGSISGKSGYTDATSGWFTSVGNMLGMNDVTSSFSAGSGGIGAFRANPIPRLTAIFQQVAAEDITSAGRPVCNNYQINSMSGFIACDHVEIPLPAMDAEVAEVKRLMEGGFFYE